VPLLENNAGKQGKDDLELEERRKLKTTGILKDIL
jgi:hypothetical protein